MKHKTIVKIFKSKKTDMLFTAKFYNAKETILLFEREFGKYGNDIDQEQNTMQRAWYYTLDIEDIVNINKYTINAHDILFIMKDIKNILDDINL